MDFKVISTENALVLVPSNALVPLRGTRALDAQAFVLDAQDDITSKSIRYLLRILRLNIDKNTLILRIFAGKMHVPIRP